jgi:hypothetical protein
MVWYQWKTFLYRLKAHADKGYDHREQREAHNHNHQEVEETDYAHN